MAGFESIALEKGMYTVPHKSFSRLLEEMDPSENYKGTALEGMDAYQRQLKRFDIRVGSGLTPGHPPHPFPSGPAGSPAAVSEKSPQPPPGNLCPMQGKAHPTCRGYGACG